MMLDEQLFRNHNELANMILQGYQDIAILNSFEQMRKNQDEFPEAVADYRLHLQRLRQIQFVL